MKDLAEQISSYNLFNNLLPGTLFVCLAKYFTDYNLLQENNFVGAFLYYFIGMIISRMGSLVVEPLLKKASFLKFSDYKSFVIASKKDEKIGLFSEVNNTYRTITAMLLLLLLLKAYNHFQVFWSLSKTTSICIAITLLLTLFLFSYRKQTAYITKRINANLSA